jgi:hypothetical protein
LSSSNVENKLKPIESDTVVQAFKHNERRNMKKVKFDLNKNIVKWISNNEIVKPIQLKKNVDLISSNLENKLQPIESVNVELEVKEALADILNIICASDKRPNVINAKSSGIRKMCVLSLQHQVSTKLVRDRGKRRTRSNGRRHFDRRIRSRTAINSNNRSNSTSRADRNNNTKRLSRFSSTKQVRSCISKSKD